MAKEAASVSNSDWSEYFASINSVCPWSLSYWRTQKIDIQPWQGSQNIPALCAYVARVWVHTQASGKQLRNIHNRLNDCRQHEEWLYSHPQYGGDSTPQPVLIQQDRKILEDARNALSPKSSHAG